jgi:hypothetical protein
MLILVLDPSSLPIVTASRVTLDSRLSTIHWSEFWIQWCRPSFFSTWSPMNHKCLVLNRNLPAPLVLCEAARVRASVSLPGVLHFAVGRPWHDASSLENWWELMKTHEFLGRK